MAETIRSRDVVVWSKDDTLTVVVDEAMVQSGWPGGQGVTWAGSVGDELLVTYSQGHFGGFLVWGSDEVGDDFAASTRNQLTYRFATMFFGSTIFGTTSYERYTLASRLSPPLVPLTYGINQALYLSQRGLWTVEDELTILGAPSAPAPSAGVVCQAPKSINYFYLGIQTTM